MGSSKSIQTQGATGTPHEDRTRRYGPTRTKGNTRLDKRKTQVNTIRACNHRGGQQEEAKHTGIHRKTGISK